MLLHDAAHSGYATWILCYGRILLKAAGSGTKGPGVMSPPHLHPEAGVLAPNEESKSLPVLPTSASPTAVSILKLHFPILNITP